MLNRALFMTLLLSIVAAPATIANPSGLSREQVDRLQRGEIVVLDLLPPGGAGQPAQGATGIALVHAPTEAVWQLLVDYPAHRGLYPRVVDAAVVETDRDHTVVRYVVGLGPFACGFHVVTYADSSRRRIDWQVALRRPNNLFREGWGYWQIDPRGPDTVLTYAMAARTVLPAFVTRAAERDGVVATLQAVRHRAELSH
jgi:ribosome-associated toxin RatA of RatAB toxin-antitoxin module